MAPLSVQSFKFQNNQPCFVALRSVVAAFKNNAF